MTRQNRLTKSSANKLNELLFYVIPCTIRDIQLTNMHTGTHDISVHFYFYTFVTIAEYIFCQFPSHQRGIDIFSLGVGIFTVRFDYAMYSYVSTEPPAESVFCFRWLQLSYVCHKSGTRHIKSLDVTIWHQFYLLHKLRFRTVVTVLLNKRVKKIQRLPPFF
jgi:hypothetical protein